MKNKKQNSINLNKQQGYELPIPDNPVLSSYYVSILQFLDKINNEDPSLSFNEALFEIFNEAVKVARHDSDSPIPASLDSKWRSLSSQILFHVQQINMRNQSSKILQYISSIKETISYTNEASPIAQAAKKEHHNIYVIIKKAISHIEQAILINDSERISLLLHNFKNELSKSYTKFFQLSQLDRASSIAAIQECKKNSDQILRVLACTNQLYVPPIEFQSFTRFINQLKLKYEVKKVPANSQRSRTPPAKVPKSSYQRNFFTNTINFPSPFLEPQLPDNSMPTRKSLDSTCSSRKSRSPKNSKEGSSLSHYKTLQVSNDKLYSRSKTPPSKIMSSTLSLSKTSNIPTRRNITTDVSKNSDGSPHQSPRQRPSKSQLSTSSSLSSSKNRKSGTKQQNSSASSTLAPSETLEKDPENDSKSTEKVKRKNDFSSTTPLPNELQKRKSRNINNNNNNSNTKKAAPLSPISFLTQLPGSLPSKKNLSRTQNLSPTQSLPKKEQCCNLISTAVNLDRSALKNSSDSDMLGEKEIKLNAAAKIPKSQSSLSQDSETDQLVMAVKKAKEQVKQLSPTLEKLQRDLSGGLFYRDDSNSVFSPSSSQEQQPPPSLPQSQKHHVKNSGQKNSQKVIQKNENFNENIYLDTDDENDVEIAIDIDGGGFGPKDGRDDDDEVKSKTIRSFDSRQSASVSKYSLSSIEATYSDFLSKLAQFDQLMSIGISLKELCDQIKNDEKESQQSIELQLSQIDQSIAEMQCGGGAIEANEDSLQIGRALSAINRRLDDPSNFDSIISDLDRIEKMIETASLKNSSAKQQASQLFMQAIKLVRPSFDESKLIIIQNSKTKKKSKGKSRSKRRKDDNRGDDYENESEEELLKTKKMLEDEIERLTIELSNLNDNSNLIIKKNSSIQSIDNLTDLNTDEKLNAMSLEELKHMRCELSTQLSQIQYQYDDQMNQLKIAREGSIGKKNESKAELESISKQIAEAHKLILSCGKNKSVEFQSKIVQKEELQVILINLIEKENQIIQSMISES